MGPLFRSAAEQPHNPVWFVTDCRLMPPAGRCDNDRSRQQGHSRRYPHGGADDRADPRTAEPDAHSATRNHADKDANRNTGNPPDRKDPARHRLRLPRKQCYSSPWHKSRRVGRKTASPKTADRPTMHPGRPSGSSVEYPRYSPFWPATSTESRPVPETGLVCAWKTAPCRQPRRRTRRPRPGRVQPQGPDRRSTPPPDRKRAAGNFSGRST